jgi:hypothetical protein
VVDRVFAGAVAAKGRLVLLGGEDTWGQPCAEIWKSDPDVTEARNSARDLIKLAVKLPLPMAVWKEGVMRFVLKMDLL